MPYLRLIAAANGIADPLDRRVVEAYWLGNGLLERTDLPAFTARSRSGSGGASPPGRSSTCWAPSPLPPAPPQLPRLPHLPAHGDLPAGLDTLEQCPSAGGRSSPPRPTRWWWRPGRWSGGGALVLGEPAPRPLVRSLDGYTAFPDLALAIWWPSTGGGVAARLSPHQGAALERETRRHLALANRTLEHRTRRTASPGDPRHHGHRPRPRPRPRGGARPAGRGGRAPALHALPAAEVWAALASRPQGLRPSEAAERWAARPQRHPRGQGAASRVQAAGQLHPPDGPPAVGRRRRRLCRRDAAARRRHLAGEPDQRRLQLLAGVPGGAGHRGPAPAAARPGPRPAGRRGVRRCRPSRWCPGTCCSWPRATTSRPTPGWSRRPSCGSTSPP